MADLKKAAQAKRFGSVVDIGGSDFVREVTHAGPDVWVVLHLYKDGCAVLLSLKRILWLNAALEC